MALPAQAPLYRVLVLARYEFPFHLWLSNAFEAQLGEHAPARLSVVMLCDASVAGSLERDKLEARKYEKIIGFAKYEVNGCVELTAYEEHRASPFAAVVSQAEQDVLRAARLREFFGLASTENVGGAIGVAQATLFRDKVAMKRKLQCAAELGVELPDFAVLDGASALVRFLAEHRFPEVAAVVKPICGMGSISTTVLRSAADVQALLRGGLSATVDGAADLEVESFVSGQMYHIDGFMERGTVRLIWPSRYVNTCVDFQANRYLGSHSLEPSNPLAPRLCDATRRVLRALTHDLGAGQPSFAFHVELWHTPADTIAFCEAACRAGGAGVVPATLALAQVSLNKAAVQAQAGLPVTSPLPANPDTWRPECVVGWSVLYPPGVVRVNAMPRECPLPAVIAFTPSPRTEFERREHCTDEWASFVFCGASEAEVVRAIADSATWLDAAAEVSPL